ncbi:MULTISPECIES: hypothetical protein [unclassified Ensifer]|uniref:hypothetical protein n=1 Tax=unclassified Ensifer TaxID=2633371 RepID=UPI00081395E5|nr:MULTISPECIES: hypothetical protein [unclassified Ensifer]OCP05672.1 hypothetical protein BBX50_04035 [Ensifer sp. LC11]OCP06414.1 hypothetical protein BC374_04095 [Ensifer sp. LC13]OCP06860.1 hypothetical protein BC362_12070 [Ensifer sp. LC14]OCP31347.1 hypothetical protein BC364_06000 [Ensifer sp. LC499]
MAQAETRTGGGRRKALWAAVAVVAIAATGVVGGKFMLEKAVGTFIAERGGKAGSVEADFLGRIHLRDVTLPFADGVSARIAAIDGRPKIFSLSGKLEVKGLDLDLKAVKLSMPQATLEEPDFFAAGHAASGDKADLLKRIERFAAKRVSAPEVAVTQNVAGSEQKTVYKDVALEDIAGGRVARYSASGATFAFAMDVPDGEGATRREKLDGTMGAVTGENFDAAYMARIYTEKAGPEDKEPKLLYGPLSVKNLAFSDSKSRFGYDEVRSSGLSVRMPAEPLLDTLKQLESVTDIEALPPAERQVFFKRVLSLVDMLAKGDMELIGLKMEVPEQGSDEGKMVKLAVDKMAFELDGRSFDGTMNGVSAGEGADYFKVAEASIKGFSWAPTMEALTKLAGLKEEEFESFPYTTLMPEFGTIRMAGLDVDMPGTDPASVTDSAIGADDQSATESEADPSVGVEPAPEEPTDGDAASETEIPGDAAEDPMAEAPAEQAAVPSVPERVRFTLDTYELALTKPRNGIPTDVRVSYRDLSVPIPADTQEESFKTLRKIGLDKLVFSSNVELSWDESNENLVIKDISLDGKDMGSFAFSGLMGGVSKDFFSGDLNAAQMGLFGLTAREAKVTLEDKGILAKGIKLYAEDNHMTEDSVRGLLVLMTSAGVQHLAATQPKLQEAATALTQFISKPGTFTLTVKAKEPAGVGALELIGAAENPALLLDKVDLEATAQ